MAVNVFPSPPAPSGDLLFGIGGITNQVNRSFPAGHYAFYLSPTSTNAFLSPVVSFLDDANDELGSASLVDFDLGTGSNADWVAYIYLPSPASALFLSQEASTTGVLRVSYSDAEVMLGLYKYTTTTASVQIPISFRTIIFGGGGTGGTGNGFSGRGGGGGGGCGYITDVSNIAAGTYTITVGAAGGASSVGAITADPGLNGGSGSGSAADARGGNGGSGGGAGAGGGTFYSGAINGEDGQGAATGNTGGIGSGVPTPDSKIYGASAAIGQGLSQTGFLSGGNGGNQSALIIGAAGAPNSASGGGGGSASGGGNQRAGGAGGSGVVFLVY